MSFASPYFLTWDNVRAMLMSFSIEGIVVVGMTILLIVGGIDLSVGSVVCFAMVVGGSLFLMRARSVDRAASSPSPAAAASAPSSACVTRIGLNHFIASLAFMVIVRGLCLLDHQGHAAVAVLAAAGVQVHRAGQFSAGARRHPDLPRAIVVFDFLLRRSTLLPQGVLHRQQREGGALFRHQHQPHQVIWVTVLLAARRRRRA